MERERPEYLPPIKARRWSFPWLTVIGLTVLVLAGFGIKQHLDTQVAWNKRFTRQPAAPAQQSPAPATIEERKAEAARQAMIAEIRLRRQQAERDAMKDREGWRCINGIPFRQIPGGWENVPGERC